MINFLKSALRKGRKLVESAQGLAVESTIVFPSDGSDCGDGRA